MYRVTVHCGWVLDLLAMSCSVGSLSWLTISAGFRCCQFLCGETDIRTFPCFWMESHLQIFVFSSHRLWSFMVTFRFVICHKCQSSVFTETVLINRGFKKHLMFKERRVVLLSICFYVDKLLNASLRFLFIVRKRGRMREKERKHNSSVWDGRKNDKFCSDFLLIWCNSPDLDWCLRWIPLMEF